SCYRAVAGWPRIPTALQVAQAVLGDLKAGLQIGHRGLQLCQPLQVGSRFVGKLHGATGLRLELSQGVLGVDLARPGLGEKAPAARAPRACCRANKLLLKSSTST